MTARTEFITALIAVAIIGTHFAAGVVQWVNTEQTEQRQ